MNFHTSLRLTALALAGTAFLVACGGGDEPVVPEETRAQDSRIFAPADPTATTFTAIWWSHRRTGGRY